MPTHSNSKNMKGEEETASVIMVTTPDATANEKEGQHTDADNSSSEKNTAVITLKADDHLKTPPSPAPAPMTPTPAQPTATTSTTETPLPKFHVFLAVLVLTNEGLCNSLLLPFVGFLIVHYNPEMSREQAGFLSGFIVGAFQIAQIPFSRYWGSHSDRNGRRPVVLYGLVAGGLALLGFGWSPTLWLALAFRILQGAGNGNAAICKTVLADMTDKSNQARAFSFVSVAYATGQGLGPVVGGLLYNPTVQWPSIFGGIDLFAAYPALLPCLVVELYIIVTTLLIYFYLPETNKKVLRRRAREEAARYMYIISLHSISFQFSQLNK